LKEGQNQEIVVRGAAAHNLAGFEVRIPRRSLTVITGVSGSGKSSLAFDTLFREGQRRFLETMPAFARHFVAGLERPVVQGIEGLGPAIALGQRVSTANPRSTVGTLTEGWDFLRLLFARLGTAPGEGRPTRGLFSFNGEEGACPACQGLGVEDRLDLDLLVADPRKSLREGALRVSNPNGYLMYSQVTLAVLDEVLRAHGGSVDIPWEALGDEARQAVLYGSEQLKVPYGKHPLESRLKWTGITARPRQDGFYRGLVPVMEEILRGKRNDSILRYVRSRPCSACAGQRLRPEALAVTWRGKRITELAAMPVAALRDFLGAVEAGPAEQPVLDPIRRELQARCDLMAELGLGTLSLDRPTPSLSRGELQRLRLVGLALGGLRGLLVVLDEPSAGLHPQEVGALIGVLQRLRDQGQTVVVVEHEARLVRAADWLIDLGPGPGREGGRLLFSGPPRAYLEQALGETPTPTQRWLAGEFEGEFKVPGKRPQEGPLLRPEGLDLELLPGALQVVCGLSGSGKGPLLRAVAEHFRSLPDSPFPRVVSVDAEPIGRTPRSNAATYTGAFDFIRERFAASPEAKARGFGKGHFSFNTAGGRCEACEGAGVQEVGMRHLGSVARTCEACGGRRFHAEVLEVRVGGRSIAELLEGSIAEAAALFADHPTLSRILRALGEVGLGYLPLGQPATTLSGGEAQRVKLATELARTAKGPALLVLDEPTGGLHAWDVQVLLGAWERLLAAGHTLLVADNHLALIRRADRVTELAAGKVLFAGSPRALADQPDSPTGAALRERAGAFPEVRTATPPPAIELRGVRTHNLQDLDLSLPAVGLTVITGPSGSGKSSLAFDTLLAEGRNRFADLVSPWARRFLPRQGGADLEEARGLQASLALAQAPGRRNPRATVGSVTELDGLLRLLYARAGTGGAAAGLLASDFSPHSERGACPRCRGLGFLQRCDPTRLIRHSELPLDGGALAGTRFGAYLGEAEGQFMATLHQVAAQQGLDLARPWRELDVEARRLALHGTGEVVHDIAWRYRRGRAAGVHALKTPWPGLLQLVEREYERVHADAQGEELEALLVDQICEDCGGEGLREGPRSLRLDGRRLPELLALPIQALGEWVKGLDPASLPAATQAVVAVLRGELLPRLEALEETGLGYLTLRREMASLSGGEAQRVRLAATLRGGLVGVTYVLDEPSQGLHAWDVARLGGLLRRLAEAGNAVVVVEHEAGLIEAADWVLELGPGSGPEGGRLMAQGPPAVLKALPASRLGTQLGRKRGPGPSPGVFSEVVRVQGARLHNLQGLDLDFPVGALVAVTGPSGSGKSSLVLGVLGPSLEAQLRGDEPVGCEGLELSTPFGALLSAEQAPLGLGWNSTVLSLMGLGEALRKRFAATPLAKARKFTARHFSTANPGGRCEACAGRGVLTVAMDLLPDVTVGCETCQGRRFKPELLECRWAGLNLHELLEASLEQLRERLEQDPVLGKLLEALIAFGLGYLRLGQEGAALSEGERQRLRLAALLAEPPRGRVAILLDEPTRGLGFEEVARLGTALRRLAEAGHLAVAVTHDLELITASDWVIDLGPGGGEAGGRKVAEGSPEQVAACAESLTGQALRRYWA